VAVLSVEDKNLSKTTINTTRLVPYKDIDLTLALKTSGDVYKKVDAAAVKQAVKNLVLTNHFEKPFNPRFGGNIRDLLFDLADDETESDIENTIISAIERYEPRALVISVIAKSLPDENSVSISVTFNVINTQEEVNFTTTLARLR
jgi:phage baseplate assembly protein W